MQKHKLYTLIDDTSNLWNSAIFNRVIGSPEEEKENKSLKRGKGDKNILLHTFTPKIEIILSKLDWV